MKKLWKNNKVFMILGIILLLCITAIIVVVLKYFVGSRKSVYGNRFDNMKYVITEKEQNDYIKALEDNPNVVKVRFRVSHKTLYISATFKDDVNLDDAKKIVDESLALFKDEVKEVYDINFTITNSSFTLMGAKNAPGNGLLWNNNTPVTE
ncbi:MAG: hypothetical protein J5634_02065 [Bacilli bacterium]|nr:hypothetical protein [Bacilli bacterium]